MTVLIYLSAMQTKRNKEIAQQNQVYILCLAKVFAQAGDGVTTVDLENCTFTVGGNPVPQTTPEVGQPGQQGINGGGQGGQGGTGGTGATGRTGNTGTQGPPGPAGPAAPAPPSQGIVPNDIPILGGL